MIFGWKSESKLSNHKQETGNSKLKMPDYFSTQSAAYVKNRPTYPEELFLFLDDLCNNHQLAWDCATGNGQCAISLSNYFKSVYATDMSVGQISNSFKRSNIIYKVELAEQSSLNGESVDMITVATAIHWFNIPAFYIEANRVLKQGGILAVWGYGACSINPEIDEIINKFSFETLLSYWPKETKLNWQDKYRTLPFPYPLIETPSFKATAGQNLKEFVTYMNSWSAVQVFIKQHQTNPVDAILNELTLRWGDETIARKVSWELFMKCGRK